MPNKVVSLGFFVIFSLAVLPLPLTSAQEEKQQKNQFRQLSQELPTPNQYRTASGAPGPEYWQQRVDYEMSVELDEKIQRLSGEETITYFNHSPDSLSYLWLQLDQNIREKNSLAGEVSADRISDPMNVMMLQRLHNDFDGGFKIEWVKDENGNELSYKIVDTMMRVDLPKELKPHSEYSFRIKWWYNINDRQKTHGRSGYIYYEEDGNYVFAVAQFFPRLAVYTEAQGWQHKQFLGNGEFSLPFGNYTVLITAPADHVIGATGTLKNPEQTLTSEQRDRLSRAEDSTQDTILIITEEEAVQNEKERSEDKKTWIFEAENVRDFAFVSSRKFIWDAMAVKFGNRTVLAMSYYDKTGNPLWERYSTKAVAHALKVYSKFTFEYPYPKAISALTARGGGMEYPMIAFNGGIPEPDGTYSERLKYSLIGVIIHEFGHNFFPMIVNSDERQWAWMDEGLNTFLEYLSEQEWDRTFAQRSGPAYTMTGYMKGEKKYMSPIMTAPDADMHVGSNAYAKTAAGLNILRETIMGRELFDSAFKEFAQRWKFKHPMPADFFRTMEDASGIDLDWFWRGWFFGTDHVDIAIDNVNWYKINTGEPTLAKTIQQEQENRLRERYISNIRNKKEIRETAMEKDKSLLDFYDEYDPLEVTPQDEDQYKKYLESLTEEEKEILNAGYNYYEVSFSNIGGMVMPLILKFEFEDGSEEVKRIPAEIWRHTNDHTQKVFAFKKEVKKITLDPFLETADVEPINNRWTVQEKPDYFEVRKFPGRSEKNLMQQVIDMTEPEKKEKKN
ncbi:MAG: M1 family metallopeptidase [Candidatus Aminicenantes bacterium]|nr:M1 family metallopeptidase [Candidatus Aminicenantes bacterium]